MQDHQGRQGACGFSRGGGFVRWIPCLVLLLSSAASAQDFKGFEVNRFHRASSQRMGYFTVESGASIPGSGVEIGLFSHYADDVLVSNVDGERVDSVVASQLVSDLYFTYSPLQNLQLTVGLPFYVSQDGDGSLLGSEFSLAEGGPGDVHVMPKLTLYHGQAHGQTGFDVGLMANVLLPTGDPNRLQGEEPRVEPRLALDWKSASGLGVAFNFGFLFREDQELEGFHIGDQLTYGLGLQAPIAQDRFLAVAEISGNGAGAEVADENALEGLLGGRLIVNDVYVTAGAGTGIAEGYGAPDFRAFLALAYSVGEEEEIIGDRDGDGYLDNVDGCPDDPEDFDNFEDPDGCPDPDNDRDTILDVNDTCPNDPEDFDGFEDVEGCPDPDNDQDGYLDVVDECPDDPEDFDDFEDEDGCPEPGTIEHVDEIIEILDRIQFEYDSDVLERVSEPIIDRVAELLESHPEILNVRIEGHTSTEGEAAHNMDLSIRRAHAVLEALVERGIDRDRLESEGFGETRPLEPDEDSARARENNRRVEFHVTRRSVPE